ncbi:hypothetical protein CDIK_3869, partial [Cucumispora dikerogammari]
YNMKMFNERRSSQFNFVIFEKQLNITSSNVTAARFLSVSQSYENVYLVDNHFIVKLVQKNAVAIDLSQNVVFVPIFVTLYNQKEQTLILLLKTILRLLTIITPIQAWIFTLSNSGLTSNKILPPQSRRARSRPIIVRIRPSSGH